MIRSNPTAIPLRANDIKMLQAEIDKRKAAREAQQQQQQRSKATASQAEKEEKKEQEQKKDRGNNEIFGLGDERRDRQGRSVADRIGL